MQPVGDDRFHPSLAKCAARLLVCEHVLQRHHMAGEFLHPALCGIDDRKAFMKFGKTFCGGMRRLGHVLPDAVRDGIQPFMHRAGEVLLLLADTGEKRLHRPFGFGLHVQNVQQALLQILDPHRVFVRAPGLLLRFPRAGAALPALRDENADQEKHGEAAEGRYDRAQREGYAIDRKEGFTHVAADIVLILSGTKREHLICSARWQEQPMR
jgi:hypothetical protein